MTKIMKSTKRLLQFFLFQILYLKYVSSQQGGCKSISEAQNSAPRCEPRPTIQHLQDPQDSKHRGIVIIPDLIQVKRCTGSCQASNNYHQCIATRKQSKSIKVIHQAIARMTQPTCHEMTIEEDMECDCQCKLRESDCIPEKQAFNSGTCQCECIDSAAMSECYRQSVGTNAMKEWNESTCDCRCKEKYRECSTGYEYDNIDTCSCVVRYRPASHSSIVILGVALAVAIATIVYLAVRYKKLRTALMKEKEKNTTASQQQSQRSVEEQKPLKDNLTSNA